MATISGKVELIDIIGSHDLKTLHVALYKADSLLPRIEFYERKPTYELEFEFSKTITFQFNSIAFGSYAIVAYFRKIIENKSVIDLEKPFGFFQLNEAHSAPIFGLANVSDSNPTVTNVVVRLKMPKRIDYSVISTRMKEKTDLCGMLENKQGLHILKLWGNPKQRGFAHGYLLAEQIIDFFRFYILEDRIQSIFQYNNKYSKFYENNFRYSTEYIEEVNAIIEGMKASNANLYVPELERNFSSTEIFAINGYIESRAACTQFVFLGESTKGSDINGGVLAGRNMDGEIDIRKVTVSHFIIFSVNPNYGSSKKFRWVSFMWPGFVGTLSGVNEEGVYSMEDAGNLRDGPGSSNLTPCSWVMKEILENASPSTLTPQYAKNVIDSYSGTSGGTTSAGSIIVFAKPNEGEGPHAFIYEGDRFGGEIRVPKEDKGYIHASNHFLQYNVKNADPNSISFNSKWRYEVGFQTLEAWRRTGKTLGLEEMKRCLQMSCHGTTEHSVIFHPDRKQIWVAIASMSGDTAWDAPYLHWAQFSFNDLF